MPRRGGKAASRRSRQQRKRATPSTPGPQPQPQPVEPGPSSATAATNSAFDAADAELRASVPPPGSRPAPPASDRSVRARVSNFHMSSTGPSRLSERAEAEYHYVARDLRNIGVLMVVIMVLLAASALAVNLLGIGAAG